MEKICCYFRQSALTGLCLTHATSELIRCWVYLFHLFSSVLLAGLNWWCMCRHLQNTEELYSVPCLNASCVEKGLKLLLPLKTCCRCYASCVNELLVCVCAWECVIAPGLWVNKLLASVTYTQPQREQAEQQAYLIDIDAMFLHVVPVVDLPPLSELHGQDPLCAQVPVDHGNLQR